MSRPHLPGGMADKDAAFAKALRAALANDKAKAAASSSHKPTAGGATPGNAIASRQRAPSKAVTAGASGDPRPPRLGLGTSGPSRPPSCLSVSHLLAASNSAFSTVLVCPAPPCCRLAQLNSSANCPGWLRFPCNRRNLELRSHAHPSTLSCTVSLARCSLFANIVPC